MSLSQEQVDLLLAPLGPERVRQVQGNAHLEAWDVRRWLLRIFGWGGWQFDVVTCDLVSERSNWDDANPMKGRHTVVYRVIGKLTIRDPQGNFVTSWEDGATGDAQNQPSLGDAHDQALKTALSQALKRCAVNVGDAFGLSLYNSGKTTAVVGRSLAHSAETKHQTAEDVTSGELGESQVTSQTAPSAPESPAGVTAPPLAAAPEGVGSPSPSPEELQAAVRSQAESLRDRAVALLQEKDRKHALAEMSRIQIDASRAKLMSEQVLSPGGDQMTLTVLLDQVLKMLSREKKAS